MLQISLMGIDVSAKMVIQRLFRSGLLLILIMGGYCGLFAQTTNLSGVVNTYIAVTGINIPSNELTLSSSTGLVIGDTVFVIQMQGAIMNSTNTASFGNIVDPASAGKYEFNVICGITGNTITLERNLLNAYDPVSGSVQLIPVTTYNNVNVNGALTAQAWNGSTGGVIVIAAPNGFVSLGANITANGVGFRGGVLQDLVSGCTCANFGTQYTDFFYPINNWRGARKGEGIASIITNMESGRGKQVTGGGGGNDHNSGGAGGGNFGDGGNGGNASASSCFFGSYCRGLLPGVGGMGLNSTYYNNAENRLFMGGGGGAGDYGNASVGGGSPGGYGTNGGGIIFIWADSVSGNNRSIQANGVNVPYTASADGGGGGGAGGTIVLDVRAFGPSTLTLQATGGRGANHSWGGGTNNCKGTGGGGGGGVIWLSENTIPVNLALTFAGGLAGIQGGASCSSLGNAGSTNGGSGAGLTSLSRQFGAVFFPPCAGPLAFSKFTAQVATGGSAVELLWNTADAGSGGYFEISRSFDGQNFRTIASISDATSNQTAGLFTYLDKAAVDGPNWYQIKRIDLNGRASLSEIRMVVFDAKSISIQAIYPNPVKQNQSVTMVLNSPIAYKLNLGVFDLSGKSIFDRQIEVSQGSNTFTISTEMLSSGIYFLKINGDSLGEITRKLQVN